MIRANEKGDLNSNLGPLNKRKDSDFNFKVLTFPSEF